MSRQGDLGKTTRDPLPSLAIECRCLPMLIRTCAALAVLSGISLLGCDSSGLGRIVAVEGKVLLNDAPLSGGSLVFQPDLSKGNSATFQPSAEIGSDGTYRLYTKERAGAPEGWYRVGVVSEGPASATDPYAARKSLVAARYNDPATSGIAVEVVAKPVANAYDLKLTK